ncbi:MAG: hypothetical protein HRT61_00155 [Ekhidna sp.]|nr:hypothetical protein [Ekhidna sp.]
MKKARNLSFLICSLCLLWSCESEDVVEQPIDTVKPLPVLNSPKEISIIDFGNEGDGRDIFITFKRNGSANDILGYHLILSKIDIDLDFAEASTLPDDRRYAIEKGGSSITHQVISNFKDSDGDTIRNDQSYKAYILTLSNTEEKESSLSSGSQLTLRDKPYYEVKTLGSYPALEALSYQDGIIMAPAVGNRLLRIEVETADYTIFDTNQNWPLGGGFDPHDGSYYASYYGGGYVTKYKSDGTSLLFASGINGPIGIAVHSNRDVYITNFNENSISKVTPNGNRSIFVNNNSGLINGPDGLVIVEGELYAINFYDGKILRISSSGEPSLLATLPGNGNGYIAYREGYFYAPSYNSNRIYQIDMSGKYEIIAGNGTESSVDGPGALASFTNPNGIAIAGDTIFVGDETKLRMVIKHN